MTKLFLIAISAMLSSTAAVPASARDGHSDPSATEAKADAQTGKASPNTRYCVVEAVTGSRIATKQCKTRSEWLAEGFDPLASK